MQKLIELGVKRKERHIFKSFNPCRLKIATLLLLNVHTELEKDSAVIDISAIVFKPNATSAVLFWFADHNEVRKKIGKIIIHYDPTERRVIGTAVANFTASKVKSFTNTCLSGVKWVENLYESSFKRSHVQSVMGIFTAIITIATIYLYIVIIFTILLLLILLLWLSLLLINLPPCLYGTEGP